MEKKKLIDKIKGKIVEQENEIPYAANSGEVMDETGIIGDGCLVKPTE